MTPTPPPPHQFWPAAVAGWFLIVIGLVGLIGDRAATQPTSFAKWFIGIDVVHDVVFAPLVLFASWAAGRALPHRVVLPVRIGLATTALLMLYTWPLVRGYGRRASNPSALPLSYGRNLLVSVIAVWVAVALWIAVRVVRDRWHFVRPGKATR